MKPAEQRFHKKYNPTLLKAIDWAMEPDPQLRPQNCDELLDLLKDLPELKTNQSFLKKILPSFPWKK